MYLYTYIWRWRAAAYALYHTMWETQWPSVPAVLYYWCAVCSAPRVWQPSTPNKYETVFNPRGVYEIYVRIYILIVWCRSMPKKYYLQLLYIYIYVYKCIWVTMQPLFYYIIIFILYYSSFYFCSRGLLLFICKEYRIFFFLSK